MPAKPKMLRTKEVAERLRVSTRTVQHWVLTGILPAVRLSKGRIWLIRDRDLESALRSNNVPPRGKPGPRRKKIKEA